MEPQPLKTGTATRVQTDVVISLIVMMLGGIIVAAGMFAVIFMGSQKTAAPREQSFTVTFAAGKYTVSKPDTDGYRSISMESFDSISEPGEPALPTKVFRLLMPAGATFTRLEVISQDAETLTGSYLVKEAPTPQPISEGAEGELLDYEPVEIVPPKAEIYQSDKVYPAQTVAALDRGQMRKYTIQEIRFNPIQYQPLSGTLTLTDKITLHINYTQSSQPADSLLADKVFDKDVAKLFTNYTQFVDTYQPSDKNYVRESSYDYVIIAPQIMAESEGMTALVDYRQSQGIAVKLETTEAIDSLYTDEDLPAKIRHYLQEHYLEWGLQYVALVGTHAVIPMRLCSAELPNDYFYSELTGVWAADYRYCGDHDWYPEVYVGRIPLNVPEQLSEYVTKLITFEANDYIYNKNALLAAGQWGSPVDADTRAEYLYNSIFMPRGYSSTRLYEESGECPTIYNHDEDIDRQNIIDQWQNNHFGIVKFAAHGSSRSFVSKLCPETWDAVFNISDISSLDSDYPSIVVGEACNTADPTDNENIGYRFVRQNAISYLGSVEESMITYNAFQLYFENLIIQGQKNAQALATAYLEPSVSSREKLISSLYGEPMIQAAHVIHVPNDYPTIQEAINAALPGTTVLVEAGLYEENITMQYGVNLVGENPETTIISGGYSGNVITLDPGDSGQVYDQIISNFTLRYGADAIHCTNSASPHVRHNIIYGNSRGIYCSGGSPEITNNTITNNSYRGIYLENDSTAVIKNNNITTFGHYGLQSVGSSPALYYNNIFGNNSNNYDGVAPGQGDISQNPNYTEGFHLGAHSPSADQGDPQDDYYLEPEPNGGRINIGVYGGTADASAYNYPPQFTMIGDQKTLTEEPLELILEANDAENDVLTYSIESLPEGATFDPENQIFSWTPLANQAGGHTITFTVTDSYGASDQMIVNITVYTYTISNKILIAQNGDTVYIRPGVYNEVVFIMDKDINIIGAGADSTILNGIIAYDRFSCALPRSLSIQGFTINNTIPLADIITVYNMCDNKPTITIRNNILNNIASSSSCVYITKSEAQIINNTIVNGADKGIYLSENSEALIKNNILKDNTAGIVLEQGSTAEIKYNNISNTVGDDVGIGNISTDPMFIDSAEGDYHLQHNSPSIDSGDPADDYSLEPYPNGGRINMGAYGNTGEAAHYYICGDVNGSSDLDIDDIIFFVNYIFTGGETPWLVEAADVNGSGDVDIDDIIYLINYIFSNGPEPVCGISPDLGADPTGGYTIEEINAYIKQAQDL